MLRYPVNGTVYKVEQCQLRVGDDPWPYATANGAAIEDLWRHASEENPAYFNGTIHLVDDLTISDGALHARLLRTDFKSYLHWRRAGFPEAGSLDGFGSALIWSSDGALILGRQRKGNVNGGLVYPPSGFIDARDVGADGTIDIAASIIREIGEETGLPVSDIRPELGFWITQSSAQVSIAAGYIASMDAETLKSRIERHISSDPASELSEIVVVRSAADLRDLAMPPYARVLLTELFAQGQSC